MIILAFDPGSTSTGWCAIDTRGGEGLPITSTFLDKGEIPSTEGEISLLIRAQLPDVVAIEKLEGFAFGAGKGPGVVAALVASSRIAGLIRGVAWAEGPATVEMTAREWRKLVLGQPSATDERIAKVIPTLVHGWPSRSNQHTRDAGGLALGVAWVLNGKGPKGVAAQQ